MDARCSDLQTMYGCHILELGIDEYFIDFPYLGVEGAESIGRLLIVNGIDFEYKNISFIIDHFALNKLLDLTEDG